MSLLHFPQLAKTTSAYFRQGPASLFFPAATGPEGLQGVLTLDHHGAE